MCVSCSSQEGVVYRELAQPPIREQRPAECSPMVIRKNHIPHLLTDDLLFNPGSGVSYPKSSGEYQALLDAILDEKGRFPGDAGALTPARTYASRLHGTKHFTLNRGPLTLQGEMLSPAQHAPGLKNRFVFDADLVTQTASFDSYGTLGVSYAKEAYYVKRLYRADKVVFFRAGRWPVAFAAVSEYQAPFAGRVLSYGFIQFGMTLGRFQKCGLCSYAIRMGLRSSFIKNVIYNRPSLMCAYDGKLRDYRFKMWVAAHSGRFVPFYMVRKIIDGIQLDWEPIAQAMFYDAHRKITPIKLLAGDPVPKAIQKVNGKYVPVALDKAVYPVHNRYPVEAGKVIFPDSEKALLSAIRSNWLEAIEGEAGIAAGNGLYFGGVFTLRYWPHTI